MNTFSYDTPEVDENFIACDFSKNIDQLGNISTQDEMLINPTYWDVL